MNDPMFEKPYIDLDEWRETPVRHRYVHGGFEGTDTRFSFYFPPKERYDGRFFHYITPVPISEILSQGQAGEEDKIGFAVTSGAYLVETNGGGNQGAATFGSGIDPAIGAYRANAAAAQYSRVAAAQFYGFHRPFGYAFGGSGGAFRTIGGMENTEGVWDGAVPFVVGSPMAIPNVFCVRMHAMRILWDKFPQIVDALEPGGSGDPYVGLNTEEQEALQEVTRMGFPPKSWFAYRTMGVHAFTVLYPGMVMADRAFFEHDFWNVPGYLGANPPESLLKARIQKTSKIKRSIAEVEAVRLGLVSPLPPHERGTADAAWKSLGQSEGSMPVAFTLEDSLPASEFMGGDLIILSGAAAGKTLQLIRISGNTVILGPSDPRTLVEILPGDEVQVDNSNFLAAQTYHRHQVPGREYPVWDQFRNPDGSPVYPQRPMLLGPIFTQGASGVVPIGKFKGKMIVLACLWDREAFPWQADWYRARVVETLGASADEHFRLWYMDHALHADITQQEDPTHTVSYLGALQQALRDLSDWVEQGIDPPDTTAYKIEDGQVIMPSTATERNGIQPVIRLRANGGVLTEARVGEPIDFSAFIEVPPGTGTVVSAAWNFEGTGEFQVIELFGETNSDHTCLTVKATHSFIRPGTYFPVLLAASQRQGDLNTNFARIYNLDRVRVVVH